MLERFGVLLPQDRPVGELLEWAQRFDAMGAESLWVSDHLAHPADPTAHWSDGWALLAAMAGQTRDSQLGVLVSSFVLRPPLAMARAALTLNSLSKGRFELGLGLGNAGVCRAASSVFDDGPALADRLERGMSELSELLDGEEVALSPVPTVGGLSAPQSVGLPHAVEARRLPIVLGGHGPRVLDIAARFADRWNVFNPPMSRGESLGSALDRLVSRFGELCEAHGRDPDRIKRSILFDYAPTLQPANRRELAALITTCVGHGFDECIVAGWRTPDDDQRAQEMLDFIEYDRPGFRED